MFTLNAISFYLFSSIIAAAFSQNCPNGYTLDTDGSQKCYKVYTVEAFHLTAATQCENDGGKLISIANAFTNSLIATQAQQQKMQIWIGLKCVDSVPSNCQWDDGSGPALYNNFYAGSPNTDVGRCVYVTPAGRWLSGDCDELYAGFACEVNQGANPGGNCGTYTEYNGMCYGVHSAIFADPEDFCVLDGGHLVSIASQQENNMVNTLANATGASHAYARIGLYTNASTPNLYHWTDGTPYNINSYSNFAPGAQDSDDGLCVAMAISPDDFVPQGQWLSVPCNAQISFVCKRAKGGTPPIVTQTPPTCPTTAMQYFDNGSIYSPNYPNSYGVQQPQCQYLITVAAGQYAYITFPDFALDQNSFIDLYNNIFDNQPFITLTGNAGLNRGYQSNSRKMLVVFRSNNGAPNGNLYRWAANYYPVGQATQIPPPQTLAPRSCTTDTRFTPGTIYSPYYPTQYPPLTECYYFLMASINRCVQITFDTISTESCCDPINIYNGDSTSSNHIASLAGNYTNKIYTSTGRSMLVYFSSDAAIQFTGFQARYSDIIC